MSRPRAYTIAAILLVLYCLIGFAEQIPALAQGAPDPSAPTAPFPILVLNFAIGVIGIVAAYSVWRMLKWGVILAIIVAALQILLTLPAVFFAPMPGRVTGVIGVVWSAVIIVLLLRPAPRSVLA